MNKDQFTKETIPSVENKESLNKLSQIFRPSDVKFLLALNSSFSQEECRSNAVKMISDLKEFVDSDYNSSIGENLGLKIVKQ